MPELETSAWGRFLGLSLAAAQGAQEASKPDHLPVHLLKASARLRSACAGADRELAGKRREKDGLLALVPSSSPTTQA